MPASDKTTIGDMMKGVSFYAKNNSFTCVCLLFSFFLSLSFFFFVLLWVLPLVNVQNASDLLCGSIIGIILLKQALTSNNNNNILKNYATLTCVCEFCAKAFLFSFLSKNTEFNHMHAHCLCSWRRPLVGNFLNALSKL